MKKIAFSVAALVALYVAEQAGEWRQHSKFERKVKEVLPHKLDGEIRDAVSHWMADDSDKRSFNEFVTDLDILNKNS